MTNADMIRSMSDEELAKVLCDADCLTWLRQSAVEEAR